MKDRKNRIARSRSSHNFGNQDDEEEEDLSSPNAYLQSKYGTAGPGSDLSRSRSSHHLKSRETSPDRPGPGTDKDGAALSSWARYLKVSLCLVGVVHAKLMVFPSCFSLFFLNVMKFHKTFPKEQPSAYWQGNNMLSEMYREIVENFSGHEKKRGREK